MPLFEERHAAEAADNFRRAVRRAVVNDDDLMRAMCLIEEARETAGDHLCLIVRGDDRGDGGES
jgi:hypothetical protein